MSRDERQNRQSEQSQGTAVSSVTCNISAHTHKSFNHISKICLFQLLYEEVLSHNTLLDTITAKSTSMSENFVTQLELQDLQERYNSIKDNAMVTTALCVQQQILSTERL